MKDGLVDVVILMLKIKRDKYVFVYGKLFGKKEEKSKLFVIFGRVVIDFKFL